MFLELKSKKGIVSVHQGLMIDRLEKEGYFVRVAYSIDEAISFISNYLKDE